jgi:hypothetical protein
MTSRIGNKTYDNTVLALIRLMLNAMLKGANTRSGSDMLKGALRSTNDGHCDISYMSAKLSKRVLQGNPNRAFNMMATIR